MGMAPEILLRDPYISSVDIWSIGITAIELATGDPPHADKNHLEVIPHILLSKTPTLPDTNSWSPEFHKFIASCLVLNPFKRSSASDLLKNALFIKKSES